MSKKKIDKPKVFISYAWGTKEYQEKVLAFANQLVGDGVDVVIDKWDLSEGNDTFAFMEKCVNDESITNVLMLLDPVYAQKADSHKGGVGTETQIISPKVYEEVTQDKFIPIVFERNENDEVCKPTYLHSRLHFDLSKDDYDEEYIRLVKTLYGEETHKKPELGNKPAWVENNSVVEVKRRNTFDVIKTTHQEKARVALFKKNISNVLENIHRIAADQNHMGDSDEVLAFYKRFNDVKKEYLALLEYTIYVDGAERDLAKCLEKTATDLFNLTTTAGKLAKIFLQEIFLYTIAFYLKNDDFTAAGSILSYPYYDMNGYPEKIVGYNLFYSGSYDSLSTAMKERDDKNYICGTSTYWVENIDENYTKEQLVFADLICFNYSIYGKERIPSWNHWFPLTYIYDNEYNSSIGAFTRRLVSKQFVEEILPLFGYETVDGFKQRIEQVKEEINQREYQDFRFREVWRIPGMLNMFIEPEKVATVR